MRAPIENITKLQQKINKLQFENQLLKTLLDQAGISYDQILANIGTEDTKEAFLPNQGARIIHPKEITERMAVQ